jgi:purine-binding chemotaxis protein CheW
MSDYKKIVSFYIGERIYGVEMYFVQEFIEYIEVIELPIEVNFITGVVNLRGRIITVADLGLFFDRKPCETKTLLMVMRSDFNLNIKNTKAPLAFIVDNNGPIFEFHNNELIDVPDYSGNNINHLCSHAVKTDSGMLLLIDPQYLYMALLGCKGTSVA